MFPQFLIGMIVPPPPPLLIMIPRTGSLRGKVPSFLVGEGDQIPGLFVPSSAQRPRRRLAMRAHLGPLVGLRASVSFRKAYKAQTACRDSACGVCRALLNPSIVERGLTEG